MAERLEVVKLAPDVVVDAGAGNGHALRRLAARFPEAAVVAIDIDGAQSRISAESRNRGALAKAAGHGWNYGLRVSQWLRRLTSRTRVHAVTGDFRRLPFADTSIGCLWSNLALQWDDDPAATFVEWHRVLEVEGLVLFSTLGPDTLKELRAAWSGSGGAGEKARVHPFIDMHDIGDMLVHAGFADPVMDMETITLTYADLDGLISDLRSAGAGNAHMDRPRGLTGKLQYRRMRAAYETVRNDARLPATFEVVYGHAWKPRPRAGTDSNGVARLRIEDIGGRSRGRS